MGIMYIEKTFTTQDNYTVTCHKIVTLGKNNVFYYLNVNSYETVADMESYENSRLDTYQTFNLDLVDGTQPVLPQLYNLLLTEPQFSGGTLIQ